MGRRRSFNEAAVLESAMHTFWARGFEATSVQHLVDATGLERGSLYNAFGNKDRLFQLAFERYDQPRHTRMSAPGEPIAALRSFFDHLVASATSDIERKGCLLINSTLELDHLSVTAQDQILTTLEKVEDFFKNLILAARDTGRVSHTVDAQRAAHVMLGAVIAIRLLARARPDPQTFTNLAENALAAAGITGQPSQ